MAESLEAPADITAEGQQAQVLNDPEFQGAFAEAMGTPPPAAPPAPPVVRRARANRQARQAREELIADGAVDEAGNVPAKQAKPTATVPAATTAAPPPAPAARPAKYVPPVIRDDGDDGDVPPSGVDSPPPASEEEPGDGPPPAPVLPPLARMAARQAGWTEEDAAEFYAADPDRADKYFDQILRTSNAMAVQLARIGMQGQPQQGPQQGQQRQQQQEPSPLDRFFDQKSLDALRAQEGDGVVDNLVLPLKKAMDEALAPLKQMQEWMVQQNNAAIRREVDAAFGSLSGEFGELYGKSAKSMTPAQRQNRTATLQLADQIRSGAAMQMIEMPIGEAIDQAHAILAREHYSAQARTKLQQQVQARRARTTVPPSSRVGVVPNVAQSGTELAVQHALNEGRKAGLKW